MLLFANVVCSLAGAFLLLLTWSGRPMRGEAFMGAHLISGPAAIAFTVGTGLVLWAAPLPSTWANVLLVLLLPGMVLAMTFFPFAAFGHRGALRVKLVAPILFSAPFGIGHGAALHTAMPWVAAVLLGMVGCGGTWVVVGSRLRRFYYRLLYRLLPSRRTPSQWELGQAEFHRNEWNKVPADAGVAALLPHARSLAPEVRKLCHERLAACSDLETAIAAQLRGPDPGQALWYVTHHFPRSRQSLAPALGDLLTSLRATWPKKMRNDPHPRPWAGDLMEALECAVVVQRDGGDVRREVQAWQVELATMPKFAGLAKEVAKWLRKVS